jgi:O-antigen/teichoic acid export membrane protein
MALARKLAYNVVFNAVAKIAATALALVSIGFITRYLGKDGFGDYATMLAFFAFFNAAADLGLATVTAREISREGANESRVLGNVVALRLTISLVALLLTPLLVLFLPYSPELKLSILIAAAAFVFSSTSMVLNGIFQKHLVMDRVALVELVGKVIQLGVIVMAVVWDLGFTAVIMSLLAYMLFNAVVVYWISRRYATFSLHFDWTYWKNFLKLSAPVGIAAFIGFTYFKMDTILLSFLRSSAEVGIYNVAYKVVESLIFFPAMVAGLVLPLMSRFVFSDRPKFEIIANKTLKVFLVLVVPLVVGGFLLAPHIISIVGGAGFAESAQVLRILIFSLAFIFFGQFFNTVLVVGNLQKQLMIALGAAAVFNITLNLFLIREYSYLGAAATSVATEMLVAILSFVMTRHFLQYSPRINRAGSILLSGAIMGAFLILFSQTSVAILIPGGALVYLGALGLTQAIEKDEIMSLLSQSKETPAETKPFVPEQ